MLNNQTIEKPIHRHPIRRWLGRQFYCLKRWCHWMAGGQKFAQNKCAPLLVRIVQHQTPLLRQLKNVDMQLQHNKIVNLRLAAERIDGLVLQPGEVFSFWFLVGRPTVGKGYLDGLVLENGQIKKGIGGGLCQMGNLIYWMALHTPLTVQERWRHSYDVFPDANRLLPFGSGATLAYNYIDLQLKNETQWPFQIRVWLSEADLHGEIRGRTNLPHRYEVFEKEHVIKHEPWGGYSRHNQIARRVFEARTNELIREESVAENHALMMYQPFLSQ